MFRIIKNIMLSLICVSLGYTYINTSVGKLVISSGSNYLLPDISDEFYYNITSDNQVVCDLSTVSNMVLNMEKDGFVNTQYNFTNKSIDIIMSNDTVTYRLYYTDNKNLHILGSPYEKTKEALTYISEKKVR